MPRCDGFPLGRNGTFLVAHQLKQDPPFFGGISTRRPPKSHGIRAPRAMTLRGFENGLPQK
jgi:hypothetical protein